MRVTWSINLLILYIFFILRNNLLNYLIDLTDIFWELNKSWTDFNHFDILDVISNGHYCLKFSPHNFSLVFLYTVERRNRIEIKVWLYCKSAWL